METNKQKIKPQTHPKNPKQKNLVFSALYPIPDCSTERSRTASKILFTSCNFIKNAAQVKTALMLVARVASKLVGAAR